ALQVTAGPGSVIEGLRFTVPEAADTKRDFAVGVSGSGMIIRNVTVEGPTASAVSAFRLSSGDQLIDSRVELPLEAAAENIGVLGNSGDLLRNDMIQSEVGLTGTYMTVENSQFSAWQGLSITSGTLVARDSLINLSNKEGAVGVALANDEPTES